jgi:hypothetical protein
MPELIQTTTEIVGFLAILGMGAIAICAFSYVLREFWRSW